MKKIFASILILILISGLMTGCSQKASGANTTAQPAASVTDGAAVTAPADHGKLKVSFPAGSVRVSINILAQELGYFKEEGVTVEPVNLGGVDALTAINSGGDQLDILNTGFVNDIQSIGGGYDLTFIAGTAVEGGAVIAKKGQAERFKSADTIIDIEAVTGAKLGFVRNEAAWVITRQYLLNNGVPGETIAAIEAEDTGRVSYYAQSTNVAQAVQAGEVDLGFLPLEYAILYADAYDLEIVTPSGALSPDYVCCREVTSAGRYASKYDAFVAYETARIRAFETYKQGVTDPEVRSKVVQTVVEYTGKETEYVETCLYGGVTKYAVDPNTAGIVSYVEAAYNSGALAGNATDFSQYDIRQNVSTGAYLEALNNLIAREPDNAFYQELLAQYNAAN